ncbi:MAG: polyprenol monophosphomannose synthase [Planctomycetaceae bacterium]|jgi:dolichol-phosphate mannosyltransferase|nr:polyprenol monophosphomannose synthase [Planctomycetaceae bacterium]
MSKILVAIATYNEIENLPQLVETIQRLLPESDLLVVDDHSPDGTSLWCMERQKIDIHFDCVIRAGKLGLGTAVLTAVQYAIFNEYDFFVNLDADWSHPPEKITELLAVMENMENSSQYDIAIGSRYIHGGEIVGWSFSRKLMSGGVNFLARFWLGLPTKDNSGAFRCYRVSTLKRILERRIREGKIYSKGYSFFEEILFRLHQGGAKIIEIPIRFIDRKLGKSKINKREAIRSLAVLFLLGLSRIFGR